MRFFRYILCTLLFVTTSFAETINITWINDGKTYTQTTCEIGGDIILPETPTRRGYTFKGWVAGYTRLEYIESTGTQYIDTGVYPNTLSYNTELFVDVQYTQGNKYDLSGVLGTISDGMYFKTDVKSSTQISIQAGGATTETKITVNSIFNRHKLKWNTGTAKCYVDNQEYTLSVYPSVFNISVPFKLFTTDSSAPSNYGKGKVYSAYIKSNDTLVCNFIPAKRTSDGVVGMWDTVSEQFFTNAGTGNFIAGPVAENQSFDE